MPQIHIQKVLKDRCVVVTNNRHTIPVISDRGEFYVSATAASNALTNRSNAVGSALCHGYAAAGRHWRFATLDECVKNGLLPPEGWRARKTKPGQKPVVVKVKADRVEVVDSGKRGNPVVDDQGTFYPSAGVAARAVKMYRASITQAAIRHGRAGSRTWRFATLDECVKNGVDPGKHRTPDGAVVARARDGKTEVTLHPVPYTEAGLPRKVPAKRTQEPEATFYAVTWPDGAVTVRANHGSTWTMTRKRADDVPEEMLREAIWISKRPAASA